MAVRKATASALAVWILWGLCLPCAAHAASQAEIVAPDTLCRPGEEVFAGAYLYRGGLMAMIRPGIQGELLKFYNADGTLLKSRLTDASGYARIRCPACRDGSRFPVEVRLADNPRFTAEPGSGTVFARDKHRPFFFITLEGGLRPKGPSARFAVPLEKQTPLPGSAETVTRIAPCSTLVYLTAAPLARLNRVRAWLGDNGFPMAPILFLKSTSEPDDPEDPTLTTDLFEDLEKGALTSARLVTGDPRFASLASKNGIEAFLLEEQEETGASDPRGQGKGEKKETGTSPVIKTVSAWKDVPVPCKGP